MNHRVIRQCNRGIFPDVGQRSEHMPALDGLRALAVLGVLVTHFLPAGHPLLGVAPWGFLGVRLFFVLSGFLITSILLGCRELTDAGQPVPVTLGRFYMRRTLRIFPLFYASILVLSIAGIGFVRETWPWHATYLSNVAYIVKGEGLGHSTHFWTLAVEEQFYLVWPWLVLLLPRRAMLPAFLGCLLSAPLFRLVASAVPGVPYLARYVLPFGCLDSLAGGALLALLHQRGPVLQRRYLVRLALLCGIAGVTVRSTLGIDTVVGSAVDTVYFQFAMAGLFVWLIDALVRDSSPVATAVLSVAPLVYVGRISYAIYVVHHFVPETLTIVLRSLGTSLGGSLWMQFTLWTALSIAIASASWYGLEQPFNRLKRRFPYRVDPAVPSLSLTA
jgi:peptidoglycan/LPS O-acetylase OafA/YrhL